MVKQGDHMEKGKLLYETPPDPKKKHIIAISIIAFGFCFALFVLYTAGISHNTLILAFAVFGAFVIFGTEPSSKNPFIHGRVRIYQNGVTRRCAPLLVLFSQNHDGTFVPFEDIAGFDRGETVRRVFLWLEKKGAAVFPHIHYFDDRNGALNPICDILESVGIPEIGLECPNCGWDSYLIAFETCAKCRRNRFDDIDKGDCPYHCDSCGNVLHYQAEHEKWYCHTCEEYT